MPPATGSRPTILVVDDEPAILNLVKLILEAAGYPVLAACNSQEALSLFKDSRHSIDLLLTDISMPDTSGLELAGQASKTVPHLPVMFMTGCRPDSPHIEFLRREGPFSDCKVIRKPFTSPELLGEVTNILSTAQR